MPNKLINFLCVLTLTFLVTGCQDEDGESVVQTTTNISAKPVKTASVSRSAISAIDEVMIEKNGKFYTPACAKNTAQFCATFRVSQEKTISTLTGGKSEKETLRNFKIWKERNGIQSEFVSPSSKLVPGNKYVLTILG